MPSPTQTTESNTHIVTSRPLIAVFFAGATGIGHYTLRELCRVTASTHGAKGFRAYIVARKPDVAARVIAECSEIIRRVVSGVRVVSDSDGNGGARVAVVDSDEPTAEFIFIRTPGLELMRNVDLVCEEIVKEEAGRVKKGDGYGDEGDELPRIDYLLFTQGCAVYQPRKDTTEGLDFTMAILYYSRMRAITRLLPLLTSSSSSSSPAATLTSSSPQSPSPSRHAAIISVFAPSMEDPSTKTFPTNLSLRTNYTYNAARSNMVYMHTLFFEYLAARYPGQLSLTHIFPGLVNGPGFENPDMPAWFRAVWKWFVVPVLGRWVFTKSEDCGGRVLGLGDRRRFPPMGGSAEQQGDGDGNGTAMMMMGTNGVVGGGSYAVGSTADDCFKSKNYEGMDREDMRRIVWVHTMDALDTIEKGEIFKG